MMALGGKTLLQRLRTAAGMGPPITTFPALPSAGSVPGQLRQLSDAGNIIVQARDIWRPYGGRQVLAMRMLNPVTFQNLTEGRVESAGPFPGGLVVAGMRLGLHLRFSLPALIAASRYFRPTIGPVGNAGGEPYMLGFANHATSTASAAGVYEGVLDVLSSGAGSHRSNPPNNLTATLSAATYVVTGTLPTPPVIDFSQPWILGIDAKSAAETAVNITGATWSAGVATYTCTAHTLVTGDKTVIAGISPSGWNVAAGAIATRIDNNTFSIPMAADPGAYVSGGNSSRVSPARSDSYILTLEG